MDLLMYTISDLVSIAMKILGILFALTYIFVSIMLYRNLNLVDKALKTDLYPVLALLAIGNIILGILYLLFVILV